MGSFRRLHRSEEPAVPDPGSDPAYLNWVRRQPCCHCSAQPPSHAHHSTAPGLIDGLTRRINSRGKGKKSADRFAFPLCFRCHGKFHDAAGDFRDWDKAKRRSWQEAMSAEYRGRYEATVLF